MLSFHSSFQYIQKSATYTAKSSQLLGGFAPRPPDQGLCPWTPLGAQRPDPHHLHPQCLIFPPNPGRLDKTLLKCSSSLFDAPGTKALTLQNNKKNYDDVTGRHRGPKRKLRAGYRAPSRHPCPMCHHSYFCLLVIPSLFNTRHIFIVECGPAHFLCAMHVFEVRASSSPPRIPLCHF